MPRDHGTDATASQTHSDDAASNTPPAAAAAVVPVDGR